MGVHGLWELLAPVGRRVSVETLAGKKLAIDASIWMIQFMKAMRDEKGEMVRNAHILGFFRRICKLLYLRTKPVFVFDGGTPALKRRTVIARRRQRENAQAKIRKTAEKLLLNHLKAMRTKELAADLKKQRQEHDVKGKRPIMQESINVEQTEKVNDDVAVSYSQEQLDEMLAASLAVEENKGLPFGASTSSAAVPDGEVFEDGEEDDEEDEEMILPEMHGKVDPTVLAALPPSLQLDLLVQMRERLMAENRQKYQKVKKAPARFSELQIQAYLKTVAFRREIDGVQKSAAGRGIGGVQTSRIASEANREFIFSSSFTGDKQSLTSVGQERVEADQSQPPPVNFPTETVNKVLQTEKSSGIAGSTLAETGKESHDDVETYLDEKGHVRVSRMRALGIRMTRDLQRNLDLMKEIDQEKAEADNENSGSTTKNLVDVLDNSSDKTLHQETSDNDNDGMNDEIDQTKQPQVLNGTSIEISFEDTVEQGDEDDNLFARLVAGDSVMDFSVDNSASGKQSLHSASDVEWEEGGTVEKRTPNVFEEGLTDEGEVEWEEGFQDVQKSSSCHDENRKTVTKGALQEEAEFQEAIRRSLEDTRDCRSMNDFHEDHISEGPEETVCENAEQVSSFEGKEGPEVKASATTICQPFGSMNILENNCSETNSDSFVELNPDKRNIDPNLLNQDGGGSGALTGNVLLTPGALPGEKGLCMPTEQPTDTCSKDENEETVKKLADTSSRKVGGSGCSSSFTDLRQDRLKDSGSSLTDSWQDRLLDSGSADAQNQGALNDDSFNTTKPGNISANELLTDSDGAQELVKEKISGNISMEREVTMRNSSFLDGNKEHEIMEDHLEEELLFLGKERGSLGIEQRKLERNAESVSSEMFAECQELLQMFGLPYIISPMEAEAQCAFMEMSNLVDGVVTDDSDAFLFGAQNVYKNIFDDRKYVETYLMKDIENELGLDRDKLIRMALLLGSDYTEGVGGIGIVNAIEVVNAFPEKDGLREFREWIESPDPAILGKLDAEAVGNARRKGWKGSENIMTSSSGKSEGISCNQNLPVSVDDAKRTIQIFMDKHRNVSKNWHIPSSFPSDAVISAYASPQVDKSTEPFAWGKPDLIVLRKLCWERFGWSASKADELLLPVLKEYNKHETQLRLEAFYSFNERFAKIRSKRIKKAVKGITGGKPSELMDEVRLQQPGRGKKRKVKHSEDEAKRLGVGSTGLDGADTIDRSNAMEKPTVKQSKGGDNHLVTGKESNVKGRCRGQSRGQLSGRGRRKKNSCSTDSESSYDDGHSSEKDEIQFDRSEGSHRVRRFQSERLQKSVNYIISDESDNHEKESENCLKENLMVEDSLVIKALGGINESDGNKISEGCDVRIGSGPPLDKTEQAYSMENTGTNEIDDSFDQGKLSRDYLQFGGGFCLEEDEQVELDQHPSSPTREMVPEISNVHNIADSEVEENLEIDPSVITPGPSSGKVCLSDTEPNMNDKIPSDYYSLNDTENDSGNCYSRSLSAMPNLRRKKRKT